VFGSTGRASSSSLWCMGPGECFLLQKKRNIADHKKGGWNRSFYQPTVTRSKAVLLRRPEKKVATAFNNQPTINQRGKHYPCIAGTPGLGGGRSSRRRRLRRNRYPKKPGRSERSARVLDDGTLSRRALSLYSMILMEHHAWTTGERTSQEGPTPLER
jgi:hypothetical protein